ncbi:MAG: DNA lyase [Gammaproteobacteria bacterium]|nr:DNA lyase [Gammaproteobacteria bacterium]|tara:strand:- start:1832 stop:2518 length:687 start_codon:yes stop_codon:yes gene_type:complete
MVRNITFDKIIPKLKSEYFNPRWSKRLPPIEELIFTVLTQHTSDINAEKAFKNMMKNLKDFETVLITPKYEIAELIRQGGLANIKSERIVGILSEIKKRTGSLNIDFLGDMQMEEARDWLTSIKGIGLKTASCVLAFSFGFPVIPVDTHVHRVSQRIGLIKEKVSADLAHALLEDQIAPEERYGFHVLMINHGRNQCHARNPSCETCILNEECKYKSSKTNKKKNVRL